MHLLDGCRPYAASCGIRTKWPSRMRTPLYLNISSHKPIYIFVSFSKNLLYQNLYFFSVQFKIDNFWLQTTCILLILIIWAVNTDKDRTFYSTLKNVMRSEIWPWSPCGSFKTSTWNEYVFRWMSHPTYVISPSPQVKWYVLTWLEYLIPLTCLKLTHFGHIQLWILEFWMKFGAWSI